MFLIVSKETHEVIHNGERLHYWDNGYPVLTDENIAFVKEDVDVVDVDSIPDDLIPGKYCYTSEKGIYANPGYIEPDPGNIYGVPDEVYQAIKNQAIQEVQNELNQ